MVAKLVVASVVLPYSCWILHKLRLIFASLCGASIAVLGVARRRIDTQITSSAFCCFRLGLRGASKAATRLEHVRLRACRNDLCSTPCCKIYDAIIATKSVASSKYGDGRSSPRDDILRIYREAFLRTQKGSNGFAKRTPSLTD